MFTLGPFRVSEIEKLKTILENGQAQYELVADEDLRDELLQKFHQAATAIPKANIGQLDLSYIFVEISPEEFAKVAAEFEKIAILPPSDGTWELSEDD
jgi:hypothetical protein